MKKLFFLIVLCLSHFIFAQEDAKLVRYKTSVILGAGSNLYKGDVCQSCINLGYQINLASRVLFYKRFYFRPEFSLQRVQSQEDAITKLSFKNNTYSAFLNLEYALTSDLHTLDHRAKNEFFLSFAPVFMHHNPFANLDNRKTFLSTLQTEGSSYSKFILGAKIGLFTDFELKKNTRLGFSLDYILFLSDYVDDVSGKYIDYSKLDKVRKLAIDPTQSASFGSQRGNNKAFDSLLRFSVSYEFSFEKKVEVFN